MAEQGRIIIISFLIGLIALFVIFLLFFYHHGLEDSHDQVIVPSFKIDSKIQTIFKYPPPVFNFAKEPMSTKRPVSLDTSYYTASVMTTKTTVWMRKKSQ